jgi:diguanylate cyclase (GGDEF)-like protein
MNESSERRAQHDALTGLPNRRQLNQDLAGPLRELALAGRSAVVGMLDIDHFKRFNDEFGHKAGDITLQKVASVLRSSVRDQDRVYRYGGEEFVIIFEDGTAAEAEALAERVRIAVATAPFTGEGLEPARPVTISIGLALLPHHGLDVAALLQLADEAMYQAKAAGRNRTVLWSPARSQEQAA